MTSVAERMVAHCHSLFERGYTFSTGGNVSHRQGDGLLMQATGTSFGRLEVGDFAQCSLEGVPLGDGPRPSKEIGFHTGIYRQRPDVQAIVHLHAPAAIGLSCLVAPTDDGNVLPVVTPYAVMRVGRVPMVEYIRPGTPRLADRIVQVCHGVQAILLQNHGLIAFGNCLEAAVDVAEELEQTASIWLRTQGRARLLSDEEVAALL